MSKKMSSLPLKEKYRLYEQTVQCHESDIEFLNQEYKRFYNNAPLSLREDFGGTAALACDWVKQSEKHTAKSVDIDVEPIQYGKENHYAKLTRTEKERMEYIQGNVLDDQNFKSDVVVAFNFSYFVLKKRPQMLTYFKKVRSALNEKGAFFLDIFGGTEGFQQLEEETEYENHTYYWDCDQFNPLTYDCQYYIHFKTHHDNVKHERVFSYDWRMWTIPEIRDLLEEAGFSKVVTYWEEDGDDGDGTGHFYPAEKEDNCESWVTYICAMP